MHRLPLLVLNCKIIFVKNKGYIIHSIAEGITEKICTICCQKSTENKCYYMSLCIAHEKRDERKSAQNKDTRSDKSISVSAPCISNNIVFIASVFHKGLHQTARLPNQYREGHLPFSARQPDAGRQFLICFCKLCHFLKVR